jgi:hypothetical protein
LHWSIYVPVSNLALIPPRRTSFMLFWTAVQILWMFPMDKIAVSQKAKDDFWEQSEISFWFQSLSTASLTSLFHVILHGTILHGTNGLPPTTCIKLFNTYVLPRLLYGLETFILKPTHFNLLERFHLSFLRKIQCLPSRSVRGITYLLLGVRNVVGGNPLVPCNPVPVKL